MNEKGREKEEKGGQRPHRGTFWHEGSKGHAVKKIPTGEKEEERRKKKEERRKKKEEKGKKF